ncbi:MAG: nicotinate-nucleotide diphosphorylase (carboxylating), partial [Chitinophagaceae bacterium]
MNFNEGLKVLVTSALAEDVGEGDHSTLCCIPPGTKGSAVLKIKQEGILAGVKVAEFIFNFLEPASVFSIRKNDGEKMAVGDVAFTVESSVHTILNAERLVLNIMQRMSGIATLTHTYTEKLKGYRSKLLD